MADFKPAFGSCHNYQGNFGLIQRSGINSLGDMKPYESENEKKRMSPLCHRYPTDVYQLAVFY